MRQICNSGQCFRMELLENGNYKVIAGDKYLEVGQKGEDCTFFCQEADFDSFGKRILIWTEIMLPVFRKLQWKMYI